MPVKVRCTSCDKVLTVPDAARGKSVKCPGCEGRVAVPAEETKGKKKAATAKAAKPVDSEDAIASLDLRKVEDTAARICSKCGFDMEELDEEETECPKCGYDIEQGGMGAKARKRAMKGPDPADFYPGLAKGAGKFVLKNQMLALRTGVYSLVCMIIALGCAFMYLWLSAWPPRVFFAMCFLVSFLVIPGWLWHLDTEVIKLTLERKDKFKRLNFDFFLASARGFVFLMWIVTVAAPLMALPVGLGYYLVNSGQPEWIMGVCVGVGLIPVLWMLPPVMSHMTMPISIPGWMFWKVIQFWGKSVPACSVWLMWLVVTNLPLIGGAATIAAVWGNDIVSIVNTMESNGDLERRKVAAENAPKGKNAPAAPDPASLGTPAEVDLKPLIGPVIILLVMCLPIGYIGLFNMRTNGQYTYYFRERLELIDKAKEYKYVSKKRTEDDEDAPRTLEKDASEGVMIAVAFALVGGIGGMVYGNLTTFGMMKGVGAGVLGGCAISLPLALIRLIILAADGGGFTFERTRKIVFELVAAVVLGLIGLAVYLNSGEESAPAPAPVAPVSSDTPAMPGTPGAPSPAGAHETPASSSAMPATNP